MNDIEERVREVLARRADGAPSGRSMLAAVQTVSRRRRRRARLVAVSGMAVALAASGATVVAIAPTIAGQRRAAPAASPAAPAPARAPVVFVPGAPPVVTFPFSPTAALPAGGSPVAVTLAAGRPTLHHPLAGAGGPAVTVSYSGTPPTTNHGSSRQVKIRGRIGTIVDQQVTGGDQVLTWQEKPNMWVDLRVRGAMSTDALLAYANGLVARPLTMDQPFTFQLVPDGFIVDNIIPSAVTFRPSGAVPSEGFVGRIAVMLNESSTKSPQGRPVAVAGRAGWITGSGRGMTLRVERENRRELVIQVWDNIAVSEQDLLRFAAGIEPTASAQAARG